MSNKQSEKQPPGFMLYDDFSKALLKLHNEDLGIVIRAAIHYKLGIEEQPVLDSRLELVFYFLQGKIDTGNQQYIHRCKTNAQNRAAAGKGKDDDC